jgi:hypothetical protein
MFGESDSNSVLFSIFSKKDSFEWPVPILIDLPIMFGRSLCVAKNGSG